MNHRFDHAVEPAATELRLIGPRGPVPADLWCVEAPPELLPGVDLMQRLLATGGAIAEGDTLFVEHRAIAGLTAREAANLGLPPLAEAVAHIQARGLLTRPDFGAELQWQRPTGQPILGAARTGAWLQVGSAWRRIPDALFAIAEAVDGLNAAPADDLAARLARVAALREVLPPAAEAGLVETRGLVGTMTIAIADAFSLDLQGEGPAAKLVPILHRAGGEPDAPLLAAEQQRAFGEQQFNSLSAVRPVYTLGSNWYVVLQPSLRRALSEVRRLHSASIATKRALMANPRAFLREALGADVDETVVEAVFRDTADYSDRVVGLGLWTPRVVPWIKLHATDWLGSEGGGAKSGSDAESPEAFPGIVVGERPVPLTPRQAEELRSHVEKAIGAGDPTVSLAVGDENVCVPASHETLAALAAIETGRATQAASRPAAGERNPAGQVLLIQPNEESVEAESDFTPPRPAPRIAPPRCLATTLLEHQAAGLEWLQKAWSAGRPGVLLADDMGLGKTLQGLAFLAWLREGMEAHNIARAPLLIVAPTGLLQNWRAEHDNHLRAPGLGRCTEAFGRGLAALKRRSEDGRPGLEPKAISDFDWVLTTYETLRDYDKDFGRVRFAAVMFDEAQKIKTPGVRITDAAKAMNANFRVALTGTPVENRLADLWCITDAVHPALLGDLKSFSATYERAPDLDRLRTLKQTLDQSYGGRPPLMLRRLKQDRLPDLPLPTECVREASMPPRQREAYDAALAAARIARKPGAVLEALLNLRAISLHPDRDKQASDDNFIGASARLQGTFQVLDRIARAGERALIFVDDLELQARMSGIIQRRYSLPVPPMLINGEVDGAARQTRVDRFQAGLGGFEVMILSPRAGGVGLTLTRANHAIHLSRWWNPAVEDQCTGRVLRIGQTRPVFVHIPMAVLANGNVSFDQNLNALLQRKRRLMQETLMPADATAAADRDELLRATIA